MCCVGKGMREKHLGSLSFVPTVCSASSRWCGRGGCSGCWAPHAGPHDACLDHLEGSRGLSGGPAFPGSCGPQFFQMLIHLRGQLSGLTHNAAPSGLKRRNVSVMYTSQFSMLEALRESVLRSVLNEVNATRCPSSSCGAVFVGSFLGESE